MSLEELKNAVLRGEENEEKLSELVRKALGNQKISWNMDKVVSRLKPYLKHENPKIRLAAIRALEKPSIII